MAVPSQWVTLSFALKMAMAIGLVGGTYALCAGMYIAAIWEARGIPGGGRALNRVVSGLYAVGTCITIAGGALLTFGLLKTCLAWASIP